MWKHVKLPGISGTTRNRRLPRLTVCSWALFSFSVTIKYKIGNILLLHYREGNVPFCAPIFSWRRHCKSPSTLSVLDETGPIDLISASIQYHCAKPSCNEVETFFNHQVETSFLRLIRDEINVVNHTDPTTNSDHSWKSRAFSFHINLHTKSKYGFLKLMGALLESDPFGMIFRSSQEWLRKAMNPAFWPS